MKRLIYLSAVILALVCAIQPVLGGDQPYPAGNPCGATNYVDFNDDCVDNIGSKDCSLHGNAAYSAVTNLSSGKSVYLDGTGDFINTTIHEMNLGTTWSFLIKFRSDGGVGNTDSFFAYDHTSQNPTFYNYYDDTTHAMYIGLVDAAGNDAKGKTTPNSQADIGDGKWHTVGYLSNGTDADGQWFIYDGKFYSNSKLLNQNLNSEDLAMDLFIGGRRDETGSITLEIKGWVDEFLVFNDSEISQACLLNYHNQNYTAGAPPAATPSSQHINLTMNFDNGTHINTNFDGYPTFYLNATNLTSKAVCTIWKNDSSTYSILNQSVVGINRTEKYHYAYFFLDHNNTKQINMFNSTINGSLNGNPPLTDGFYNGIRAINFSGKDSNEYVTIGTNAQYADVCVNGCTMSAWINPQESETMYIISRYDSFGDNRFFTLQKTAGNDILFAVFENGDAVTYCQAINSNDNLVPGTWYHVAGVYNKTHIATYINGNIRNTATCGFSISLANWKHNENTYIGTTDDGSIEYEFHGMISDVMIYSDNLSENDMLDYYNGFRDRRRYFGVNDTNFSNTTEHNNIYFAQCNITGATKQYNTTDDLYLYVDNVNPLNKASPGLRSNNTLIYGSDIARYEVNCSDTNLYGMNVTLDDGTILFNKTNIAGITQTYLLNLSSDLGLSLGSHTIRVECSDEHTAKEIGTWDYSKNALTKSITYHFSDGSIQIVPDTKGLFSNFDTYKQKDRYTFEFTKGLGFIGNDLKFTVLSNHKIDVIGDSKHSGHLVINGLKKWIDFDIEGQNIKATLKQKSPYEVEVSIKGAKNDVIKFKSIGGLNIVNKTYKFFYGNITETYNNRTLETDTVTFTLNISKNTSFASATTAKLIWNKTTYSPTKTLTSTYDFYQKIIDTTLLGGSRNQSKIEFYWNYTVYGADTTSNISNITEKHNQTFYRMIVSNCSSGLAVYKNTTLNISIQDYEDNTAINGANTEALFILWNRTKALNRTIPLFYNHNATPQVCIYPNWSYIKADYQIEFTATGYDNNQYNAYANLLNGTTPKFLEILLVNSTDSTKVTVTVVDENDNELVGYLVEAWEYDLGTNTYTLISTKSTNADGKTVFYLDVSSNEYQWRVKDTDGILVYTEPKSLLLETEYTLRVNSEEPVTSIIIGLQALTYSLSVDSTNNNFSLIWNDATGLINRSRLKITKSGINYTTTLSNQISSDAVGGLYHNVSDSSGTYIGYYYVISSVDSKEYLLDTVSLDLREEYDVFGVESLFMAFFFVGTLTFIGLSWNAGLSLVLGLVGMFLFWALGFIEVSLGALIGVIISGIIVIIRITRR